MCRENENSRKKEKGRNANETLVRYLRKNAGREWDGIYLKLWFR